MSYCRWSSDNFGCDIYAYYSVNDSYVIHVASKRVIGNVPELAQCDGNFDEFMTSYEEQDAFLDSAKREVIGLPCDGMTFEEYMLEDFRDNLLELRDMGYRIPNFVFKDIQEELEEENVSKLE